MKKWFVTLNSKQLLIVTGRGSVNRFVSLDRKKDVGVEDFENDVAETEVIASSFFWIHIL